MGKQKARVEMDGSGILYREKRDEEQENKPERLKM